MTSTFASYTYSRDGVGQLQGDGTNTYNNDPVNRLTTVNGNTTAYGYDAADEVTKTPSLSTTPTSYDAANELVSGTLNGFPMTAGYDARGNRTSTTVGGSTTTAGFDQANRMVSFTGNGTTTSYSYNGDGLRMKKGSTQFGWDVAEGMPLMIQDASASYITGPGGVVIEQVNSAQQAYFLHQDQLGSTRWISDSAGNVLGLFNYDSYGKLTVGYSTVLTPFQFAGQYLDSESGLYYLRARYYDPQTAQFISRDPAVTSTREPYVYVYDNPVNLTDPAGLDVWGDFQNVILAASQGLPDWARHGEAAAFGGAASWVGQTHSDLLSCDPGRVANGVFQSVLVAGLFVPGEGEAEGAAVEGASRTEGIITGFTRHGINQAISNDGHGVAEAAMIDTVKNPIFTEAQEGGKILYQGKNALVVLSQGGKVVTTWAMNHLGWRF